MIRILRLWPKLASIGLLTLSHCSLMNLASLDEAQTVGAIQDNDGGIGSAEFGHDASVGAAVGFVQASDGSAVTADCAPPGAGDLTSTMLSDGAPEDASEGSARDAVAETSISDGGRPEVGPADASTGVSEGGGIGPADAALDALGWCDAAKPFGAPVLMTSLESTSREAGLHLFGGELSGLFWQGPLGATTLYAVTRTDKGAPFGNATLLKNVNGSVAQYDPSASDDGLMLVFRTNATGAANGDDIYWASRSSTASDFSNVVPLAKINTSFSEVQPFLTPDGMEVYFSGNGTGDYDIYRAVATAPGTFPTPSAVKEVNASGAPDQNPTVSADDLTMVFSSGRFGGQGGQDVWITKRPNKTSAFGPPVNLSEVNSGANDYPSWISADGCRLYMYSDRSGTLHVYSSSRPQ